MTEPTRRDRREERGRRRRTRYTIAGVFVLVVAIGVTVFLVAFRDDDSPTAKSAGTSTTTKSSVTTTTRAPDSSGPPASEAPSETTTPPASTTPPPLASAPPENASAPGSGCGGDNQSAIVGTWRATAPTGPIGGEKADLSLRQQDGASVAGLPVTVVVTGPGGRTYSANPVAVAPVGDDATVVFPADFPRADQLRLEDTPGLYGVRWQTLGGGSLACAGFQAG